MIALGIEGTAWSLSIGVVDEEGVIASKMTPTSRKREGYIQERLHSTTAKGYPPCFREFLRRSIKIPSMSLPFPKALEWGPV